VLAVANRTAMRVRVLNVFLQRVVGDETARQQPRDGCEAVM
jgi:hypothetical protein